VVDMVSSGGSLAGRELVLDALRNLLEELEGSVEWENDTLERYLEALHALLGSIENAYTNTGRAIPEYPWAIMAEALEGARYYE
jgi:hypothetical protein